MLPRLRKPLISSRLIDSSFRVLAFGVGVLLLLFLAPFVERPQEKYETLPVTEPSPEAPARVEVKLRRGDTLLSLLTRHGLRGSSAHELISELRPFLNVRKLSPGDPVQLVLGPEDRTIRGIDLTVEDELVRVRATAEGWQAERRRIPRVIEARGVRGAITSSLYQSGTEAGLTPQQILDLARVFEYDIDFFSDFRAGDLFAVLFEDLRYVDGRRVPGKILAAELEADGQRHEAFYFVPRNGDGSYYDSEGRAVRRTFLRAPLSYARISSPFSVARRHPIFRTVRPHLAIDYAAPAGTPVVAVGPGRVAFAGWRGGYGKMVEIRHAGGYSSRYGHFSRIAPEIRPGRQIDAGEVVGYVGRTGHATGPHLHFEFLRGSEKINFLSLKVPHVQRLEGDELRRFMRERDERLVLLRSSGPLAGRAQTGS